MRDEELKPVTFYVTPTELDIFKLPANRDGITLSAQIRLLLKLPSLERGAPTGNKNRRKRDREEKQMNNGLTFEKDIRHQEPDINNRRKARFHLGWKEAIEGKVYKETSLKELTWQNTGYRIGKILGEASNEHIEQMYKLCVVIQQEKI